MKIKKIVMVYGATEQHTALHKPVSGNDFSFYIRMVKAKATNPADVLEEVKPLKGETFIGFKELEEEQP